MPLSESRFGLSVALATPFAADGTVDLVHLGSHANWCLSNGCRSVTLFGTTGEGPSISLAERQQGFKALLQAGVSPGQIVVGVTANAIDDAILATRQALADQARNVLLAPPFYFSDVSKEGVIAWYRAVIAGLGEDARDLILYNIPSMTGVPLGLDVITALRGEFPSQIVGIKDSSCDWQFTKSLLEAHRDLMILVGDERDLVKAVEIGGSGTICGIANLFPQNLAGMVAGQRDGFIDGVVDLVSRFDIVPALKAALVTVREDQRWLNVRPPLTNLPISSQQELLESLQTLRNKKAA